MNPGDAYVTLLSSLPDYDSLTTVRHTPLSRLRLERRLALLSADDRQLVAELESILEWRNLALDSENHMLVQRQQAFLRRMQQPDLTTGWRSPQAKAIVALVQERLDARTLVAALWYRHYRSPDQPPAGKWSASRLRSRIEQHWKEPDFKLGNLYPWLDEALLDIRNQQPLALEKRLLQSLWRGLDRHRVAGDFSLLAVVIYLLKWDLISRWTRYQAAPAQQRFEHMIDKALQTVNTVSQPGQGELQ